MLSWNKLVLAYGPDRPRAPEAKLTRAVFWPVIARPAVRILSGLENFDLAFFGPAWLGPLGLARTNPVGA